MRVSLFSTAVLILTLIAAGGSALACDCPIPSKTESFKRAEVGFEGTVVLILYSKEHPLLPVGHEFQVTRTLKGEPVTEITILKTGSNCDAEFTLGSAYRVYARQNEGKLTSTECSGNQVLRRKKTRPPRARSYVRAKTFPGFCPEILKKPG